MPTKGYTLCAISEPSIDESTNNGSESNDRISSCWNAIAGAFAALCGGICLSVSDAFLMFGVQNGISPSQQLMVKSIITIMVMIPLLAYRKVNVLKIGRNNLILNIIKSSLENGCDILFYYALVWVGLGNATAIDLGGLPVFTPIIAFFVIGERIACIDIIVIFMNVVGIILISRPEFLFGSVGDGSGLGYIFAVLTSLAFSIGAVCSRGMSKDLSVLVVLLFNGICGLIISQPIAYITSKDYIYTATVNHPANIGYMVGMVGFYMIYCWSFNKALQLEAAGRVIILFNIGVVVSFLLDVFVFHRVIHLLSIVGTCLILLTSLVTSLLAWKENDKKDTATSDQALLMKTVLN
ncbi:solute carrier family 35 member G1-like [Glandiceps talaboti]